MHGYSVRLYVNLSALPKLDGLDPGLDLGDVLGPQPMGHGSPVPCTHPLLKDTDGDGLEDMEETSGSKNPYNSDRHDSSGPGGNTDPCSADTDGDTIRDGVELGFDSSGEGLEDAWVMDPNEVDADGDGKQDNEEDDGNGIRDLNFDDHSGVYNAATNGEISSPVDADTDDDGVRDDVEILDPRLNPLTWDTDEDGLSDGLETGVTSPVVVDGITHTVPKNVFDLPDWPTFQAFPTKAQSSASYGAGDAPITTDVGSRDSDGDGLIDGLEDVNHNGKFGDFNSVLGAKEVRPNAADSDGDGIVDGKELLFYGTYTFQQYIEARGTSMPGLTYEGGTFKTDLLLKSTDTDGIIDGKDINPKEDGLMFLKLDAFYQYDPIDGCCGFSNHKTDLVLLGTLLTVLAFIDEPRRTIFPLLTLATLYGWGIWVMIALFRFLYPLPQSSATSQSNHSLAEE